MKLIKFLLNLSLCCLFKLIMSLKSNKYLKSIINSGNHTKHTTLHTKNIQNQNNSLTEKIKLFNNTHDHECIFHNKTLNSSSKNSTEIKNSNHIKSNESQYEKNTKHPIKEMNKTDFISQTFKDPNETNKLDHEKPKNNSGSLAVDHINSKFNNNSNSKFKDNSLDAKNKTANHTSIAMNKTEAYEPKKTKNNNKTVDKKTKKEDNKPEANVISQHNYSHPFNSSKHLSQNNHTIAISIDVLKNLSFQNHNKTSDKPDFKTNKTNHKKEKDFNNENNKSYHKENKTHLDAGAEIKISKFINITSKNVVKTAIISPIIKKENNKIDVIEKVPKPNDENNGNKKGEDKDIIDYSLNVIGKKDESDINEDVFSFPTITRLLGGILI